jgi:hypothetical protein
MFDDSIRKPSRHCLKKGGGKKNGNIMEGTNLLKVLNYTENSSRIINIY